MAQPQSMRSPGPSPRPTSSTERSLPRVMGTTSASQERREDVSAETREPSSVTRQGVAVTREGAAMTVGDGKCSGMSCDWTEELKGRM